MAAVARREVPDPVHGRVLLAGVSPDGPDPHRDSAVLEGGHILLPGAGSSATIRPASSSLLPGGPGSRPLTLAWRDTEVTLPLDFYLDYLGNINALRAAGSAGSRGTTSSVASALDLLWPEVRAAAEAAGAFGDDARTAWRDMLLCYNLPRETWVTEMTAKGDAYRPMFWMAEWGAPFEVYCRIMQLVRTYADAAQDRVSGSTACDGYSSWLRRAVMGEDVKTAWSGTRRCKVGIQFRNADAATAWSPGSGAASWLGTCTVAGIAVPVATGSCTAGYDPELGEDGVDWDDWASWWDPSDVILRPVDTYRSAYFPENRTSSRAYVATGLELAQVHFHPNWLAWHAYICDHLLFLARITLDYYRWAYPSLSDGEAEALQVTARRFARYALRLMVDCAELLIHELGHIYTGGGHCDWSKYPSDNDCCFGMAGARFSCFAIQALGLPPGAVDGPYLGSPTGLHTDDLTECVYDTSVLHACRVSCELHDVGEVAGGARYCAVPCAGLFDMECEELS